MLEKNTVTHKVHILDILPGDPPRILTATQLSRDGKPGRLFQQMIPVPDAALFARFTAQVCIGDTVQVTVTTEWSEDAYTTYLTDFACLPAATQELSEELLA